ncbi:DnaJ domain-containing protein [Pseudoxanthomonas sp. LjRoot143]|uniref:J domain-containing protein n=1 Tax=Pseudoxanthomonas sp. LjRoot143 TaxID=3342266 RepID=UPI003ED123EB
MSEWPYDLLEIDDDADERTIKRAYARLLKRHRPDEDPAGFQRLNEAYQAALSYQHDTTVQQAHEDGLAGTAALLPIIETDHSDGQAPHVTPPVGNAGPSSPSTARVDEARLRDELMARATHELPSLLRQHLAQHPDLYSLEVKRRIGSDVFEQIAYEDKPVSPGNLAVLGEFFGFTPPEWVEKRTHVMRAVENEDTQAFDEDRPLTIRQLKRPFRWPLALLLACMPGFSIRAARLSQRLTADYGDDVPGLDRRQQGFFSRLADPFYAGAWRWATVLLSALVATLLIAGLCHLTAVEPDRATRVTGMTFAAVAGMLCMWHAMRVLWALRDRPSTMHAPWIALMPVWLAVAGLLAALLLPGIPALGFALVLPAALLHFRQFFDVLRFGIGVSWLVRALPIGEALSPWVAALAGAAIGVNICDWAFARRHRISLADAAGNRWTTVTSFVVFVSMVVLGLVLRLS